MDDLHDVDRWCRLLQYGGIVADPTDLALPVPPVPSPAPGAVVIHPGAAFPARRWPPEHFAAVARTFAGDVVELAALVAGAALVVCGDTGPGHLATAFGTPSVLLFGPTPPSVGDHRPLVKSMSCCGTAVPVTRSDPSRIPGCWRSPRMGYSTRPRWRSPGSRWGQAVPKRVAVVGAGYVGLTTAGCLAYLGHDVVCVDVDEGKVAELSQARVAIKEPDLGEVVADGLAAGRLRFTTCLSEVDTTEVVFLCVPTPMSADGAADLGPFDAAVAALSVRLRPATVLVTKSTVPVGTAARTTASIGRADIAVASNPEFLREGHAVHDFLHPDRILIGADDRVAGEAVARLYAKLTAPVVHSDPASAELAKYASNAFLAVKLSYINLLAQLCEQKGADIGEVTKTMGLDPRIGPAFLAPGPG
jgi:predicted dinucleotide-binding enzyme